MATATASTSLGFVSWEELFAFDDERRKEVRFYVKRRDGSSNLIVRGKDKIFHHVKGPNVPFPPHEKLKSRSEVVGWLNSIVSESARDEEAQPSGSSLEDRDASQSDITTSKKLGRHTKPFSWIGHPWRCRDMRWHYQGFRRNGFKISVHSFVYILTEEGKCPVAYVEDMYEDLEGQKKVMVQWFDNSDEVGIVSEKCNDREIFFPFGSHELSVECIDGIATVLGPRHFKRFQNKAIYSNIKPFVCKRKLCEKSEPEPFNITLLRGYWEQEIIKKHFVAQSSLTTEDNVDDNGMRPNKRSRRSKGNDLEFANTRTPMTVVCRDMQKTSSKSNPVNSSSYLAVGSLVEVLSQDSGIRGCWNRALIVKKHKHHDRVKVQYQHLQDPVAESKKLEEWISLRIADPDDMAIRIAGRTTIRPIPPKSSEDGIFSTINVGTAVDVWWSDAWWEGIVIQKEPDETFCVYFPGEKKESTFRPSEMRHSKEWLGSRWMPIERKPEVVTLLSLTRPEIGRTSEPISCDSHLGSSNDKVEKFEVIRDILKDDLLTKRKWGATRKRRVCKRKRYVLKPKIVDKNSCEGNSDTVGSSHTRKRLLTTSLKVVNYDNCKYTRDSRFGSSSVVPTLTSLVLSR